MTDDGLDRYAAAIAELVLWLRDEGHVLSPMDQHFVARWFDAGYPLGAVLREVRRSGCKLKRRKSPPRGLPLSSMRAAVEKAGERARALAVGATAEVESGGTGAAEQGLGDPLIEAARAAVAEALASATDPARRAALERAVAALADASGDLDLGFCLLLAASRCYYHDRAAALPAAEAAALRDAALADLGEAAQAMDPEALQQTVDELIRRRLREADPVLDPDVLEETSE